MAYELHHRGKPLCSVPRIEQVSIAEGEGHPVLLLKEPDDFPMSYELVNVAPALRSLVPLPSVSVIVGIVVNPMKWFFLFLFQDVKAPRRGEGGLRRGARWGKLVVVLF